MGDLGRGGDGVAVSDVKREGPGVGCVDAVGVAGGGVDGCTAGDQLLGEVSAQAPVGAGDESGAAFDLCSGNPF